MVGFRRAQVFPAALVALLLVSASRAADETIDFKFYPKGAQDCLYKAADSSQCRSETVPLSNSCMCRNGGNFITSAAACIGQSSRGDLSKTYEVMEGACKDSKTPISITEDEFMEAAEETTSTSTTASATSTTSTTSTTSETASSTSTSTDTPTTTPGAGDDDGEKRTGLSSAAMAGVIIGASIVGLALVGGLGFFLFRRRRKLGEESHPMLPHHGHASLVPEASPYDRTPPGTGGFPKKDWGSASDSRVSGFNWESPAHLAYSGTIKDKHMSYQSGVGLAPSPIQELDGVVVHPTGTAEAPAEMGGTPIATTVPPHPQFQSYPGQQISELGVHPSQR